jgi:hypothetical protein
MFCTKCGSNQAEGIAFCSSCGNPVTPAAQPVASFSAEPQPAFQASPTAAASSNGGGLALAILSFVVSAFAFFSGLYDLGGIANGQFSYIAQGEVGLLAILSVLAIVMGSISMRLKHPAGRWALVFALATLFVMFNAAGHIVPSS